MSKTYTLPSTPRSMRTLTFSLAALIIGTSARANMAVIDMTAIATAVEENAVQAIRWADTQKHWLEKMAQDGAQYGQVLQHYKEQYDYWQQQLVSLEHLNFSMFKLESQFPKVDDDYGVSETCSSNESLMDEVTGMLKSSVLDLKGDVRKQQRDLCQKIVMTKNRKYNNTVDYLHNVTDATNELANIEDNRNKSSDGGTHISQGDLAANNNDVARFQGRLAKARETWQGNDIALDVQISLLERQQSILAQRAMKGDQTILGQVIQAAALEAALKINKP